MTCKNVTLVSLLIFILITVMTACGNNNSAGSPEASSVREDSSQQGVAQTETVQQSAPMMDKQAGIDSLLGNWVQIDSTDRFANITAIDSGYQYEDNDGKYTGTFKDGVLKITVSGTDTADVYNDINTGHMVMVYQGQPIEFVRK